MPTVGSIKSTLVGCQNTKNQFKKSSCVVLISVGQPHHEADNLKALLALVNNYFKECTIVVCDLLQRHNLNFTMKDSAICNSRVSLKNGDTWLERNKGALSMLTIPTRLKRWAYWLDKKQYDQEEKIVYKLYEKNTIYKHAINSTINEFIYRLSNKKHPSADETMIFKNCLNYLIEEITVVMRLMPKYGYNFIVYPNKIIEAFRASHNIFIEPISPHLMNWVHVQLKKTTCKGLKCAI